MAKLIISQKTGETAAVILGVWSDFGGEGFGVCGLPSGRGSCFCGSSSFREEFLLLRGE